MSRIILAAFAAALLAACTPAAEKTAEAPAPEMTEEEIDAASHDGPVGWLEADGAGETAVEYRAGPNAIGFRLACTTAKKLTVDVESVGTSSGPLKSDTPGTLLIGATAFPIVVSPVDDGLIRMAAETAVTPQVLTALAGAESARVVVGDAFTEAGPDGGKALKTFATACSALTGVKPAP